MTTQPTNEEGASEELLDAHGTRYVRDAGTRQLHRVGPKGLKRPSKLFDVEQAVQNVDAVISTSEIFEDAPREQTESEINETNNSIPATA